MTSPPPAEFESVPCFAACLMLHRRRMLVRRMTIPSQGESQYESPVGGPLRRGESSADAVRRIVCEETGLPIDFLQWRGAIEVFDENTPAEHRLVVVYDGRFLDERAYESSVDHTIFQAASESGLRWRSLDFDDSGRTLWPPGLNQLLRNGIHH